ncbi:MAG: hypothetical protein RM347_027650 [Nostoc sp. ChiQUE02]|uniref:hypothetical protein n=1 Tax=Nostoc sp. ChiQUE02 TaxID=3075377 RepID=UPI002AD4A52D|nr:hypothetical protein [Nostoc sp. ChiQUE02]MDZ8232097.1 hypothetical protein [Nostoc sp. ChiQUE02]
MSREIPSKFIPFQMLRRSSQGWKPTIRLLSLLVGGWLVLIPDSTPAQAQIQNSNVLLAQEADETLPPPPIPFGQQPSPQLQPVQNNQFEQDFQPSQPLQNNQFEQNFQPSQPLQNNQFEQNFQPSQPAQFSQYNQNFERYLVYVDGSDFQTLQAIRQIEPSAYIRQYQGRNVIQSGVFNRVSNAQQRVSELQSRGIYSARIISFANGQEIEAGNRGFVGDRSTINANRPVSRYYVAIPTTSEQLSAIAAQIRQNLARFSQDLGRSGGVLERTQPRGPHVAVGPFSDRFQAEEWNKYLRNTGYGNARVYYGK